MLMMESFVKDVQQAALQSQQTRSLNPLRTLHTRLSTPGAQKELRRASDKIDQALGNLDPEKHSLGWIHLLHAQLSSKRPSSSSVAHVLTLLERGSEKHFLLAALQVCQIVDKLVSTAAVQASPQILLLPLRRVCGMFSRASPHTITPLHTFFLEQCFHSQHFHASQAVLRTPKYSIAPPKTHGTNVLHVLRYFFFAGMLCCGLKQWSSAFDHFAQCLAIPVNNCVSIFQLQAYKKLRLCNVLATGAAQFTLPESTSATLEKAIRPQVEPYDLFARLLESGQLPAIDRAFSAMARLLAEDDNLGLAKLARKSVVRRKVVKIAETFVTLPLGQLTQTAGLSSSTEAEALILQMVSEGSISARIDRIHGVVTFEDAVESFRPLRAAKTLQDKIQEVLELNRVLKSADDQVRTSSNLVSAVAQKLSTQQQQQQQPSLQESQQELEEELNLLQAALIASEQEQ